MEGLAGQDLDVEELNEQLPVGGQRGGADECYARSTGPVDAHRGFRVCGIECTWRMRPTLHLASEVWLRELRLFREEAEAATAEMKK